jgi:hypothetical protein
VLKLLKQKIEQYLEKSKEKEKMKEEEFKTSSESGNHM